MYVPPWLMITFSLFEMLNSSLETGRQPAFGAEAAKADKEVHNVVVERRHALALIKSRHTIETPLYCAVKARVTFLTSLLLAFPLAFLVR
jgi:hypothetical protein